MMVMCLLAQSCLTLCNPMDCTACQASLSMEFSRQEYWSVLPFPSPGDLSDPGIKLISSALQVDSLSSEPSGSPNVNILILKCTFPMDYNTCIPKKRVNSKTQ